MSKLINLEKQMKKSELKAIINECIHEVLAEEAVDKKKAALKQIKEIISENELEEAELEEIFGLFKGPEEKAASLEAELQKKAPETYNTGLDTVTKLGWKEKKNYDLLAKSIDAYAKGYNYPSDGKYYIKNNKLFFDTKKESKFSKTGVTNW